MTKITTLQLLDPLKVFVEYDAQYGIYVAQCLQTGHLMTADDPNMAKEMITELLEDEVSLAVKNNDILSLLSNPAPLELRIRWELAAKANKLDERKITIHGEVPQELRLLLGQAEVETEIKIATGRTARADSWHAPVSEVKSPTDHIRELTDTVGEHEKHGNPSVSKEK